EKAELLKRAEQLKADVKAADAERDAADTETLPSARTHGEGHPHHRPVRVAFAVQSPLSDSNRRPSLYKFDPSPLRFGLVTGATAGQRRWCTPLSGVVDVSRGCQEPSDP
ncbi:hypothetical protein, partial [Streptomyces sp. NPDC005209]|uniref:hypothetical protein n=1 Tax=Streptomyces sp. NPDC005209 TaxID=3156715 RepID=UPI0033B611FE